MKVERGEEEEEEEEEEEQGGGEKVEEGRGRSDLLPQKV